MSQSSRFLSWSVVVATILTLSIRPIQAAPPDEPKPPTPQKQLTKKTFTYKTVDKLKIQADVYQPAGTEKRPVIVWLHGGALIMGSRGGVPKQIRDMASENDFIVVSLDYRLAPEAKLAEIIEDLTDGITWVRESGPKLFHADSSRTVVAGASAGGYLALMSGINPKTRPLAIVSYWGFGDVDGDWTTQPNEGYRKGRLIDAESAFEGVGKEVLTSTNRENGRGRATFFLYLKQTGRWVNEVAGLNPKTDRDKLTPFCPIRNVTRDYPPTLFLHGTKDNDVPVKQSTEMANELKRQGVIQETIIIEGGGHGLWGGDKELIEKAFKRSTEYMKEQLTKKMASK